LALEADFCEIIKIAQRQGKLNRFVRKDEANLFVFALAAKGLFARVSARYGGISRALSASFAKNKRHALLADLGAPRYAPEMGFKNKQRNFRRNKITAC